MASSTEKLQQRLNWWRRDPENGSLYRQCVEQAMALGQFDVLLQVVAQALSRRPTDAELLFDRANAEIGCRDYRSALTTLCGIPSASPEQRAAIDSNRAVCHYCLGEYELALPLLRDAYDQGRRDAGPLLMLVRSSHHLGLLEEAATIAKANTEAGTRDAALAGAYALAFLDANDAGSAAHWSATTLRLDPSSIDGAVTEGTLAIMRLQVDRAQRYFNAALEMAPDTGRAWVGLGTLALLRQDLVQAATSFERGLQQMPGYVGAWHMLGWTQLMRGELEAAGRSLNNALTLDRNFAETHATLAALDVMNGHVAAAERRLEIARRLDPNCFSAQFTAALLADPTLKGAKAQRIIQKTLRTIASERDSALAQLLLRLPKR